MNWLERQMVARPDGVALMTPETVLTWANIGTRVSRTAAALRSLGISQGARVAVLIDDGLQFALTALSLAWLGATLIPINRRLSDSEISWLIHDAGAELLIVDSGVEHREIELAEKPFVQVGELTLSLDCESVELLPDTLAVVMYTSGTTGVPKPVPLTWANIQASAVASAINLGLHRDDVWLSVVPLYHIGGLSILYRGLIYGTATMLQDGFDVARVCRALTNGVTLISVVPTMLNRLIATPQFQEAVEGSGLRSILVGGGPVNRQDISWCLTHGIAVLQTYGMTETASQVTTMPFESAMTKVGSAGLPVLGAQISIRDDMFEIVPPGVVGTIHVCGPMLMKGYLDRPSENARRFRDGWFDTGDYGSLDSSGYLTVMTRRDDLIISGGENVYPAQVEAVLSQFPGVREAAVFGVVDPEWGQIVAAAVVTDFPINGEEIRRWASSQIAGYKVPRLVFRVDELPRTASGKVQSHKLRERFGAVSPLEAV